MNFLNGALLPAVGLAVAIPLVIHWLNRQFPHLRDFSSVQYLRETLARSSWLFRARHRILLALRCSLLALLVLAFLKPVLPRFGSAAALQSHRSVLLLIDHSMSMEYKGGGLTARQRAQSEAEKIVSTLESGDTVNVMLVGEVPSTCFVASSHDHQAAVRFLQTLAPGLGRADFSQANAAVGRLLSKIRAPKPPQGTAAESGEIYYLSDFQRSNWAHVDFTALPVAARFFFVDVGEKSKANRAILGVTLNSNALLAGDTVTLEVEIGNFSDQPLREPIKVGLDSEVSFEKEVAVAPWSVGRFSVPLPPGVPGLHLCEVRLAPDGLSQDDAYFLTIPVLEKEGILIVSDAPDPKKAAARYLRVALNPYEHLAGSLVPSQLHASELTASQLAAVQKLFLSQAGRLTEQSAQAVSRFVFQGGGLVYFLDGEHDSENLELLEHAMGRTPLPLKLGARRMANNLGAGSQQISKGEFKSRFLRLFRGSQRQNLALLEFYDIYDASSTGSGQVLLSYSDETPAMVALNYGLGSVLLMNFSVSEFSSNLARQRIFPAWIQELVKNLAVDEPVSTSSRIGEGVEDEIWKTELAAGPLRKPSGQVMVLKPEAMGERLAIAFVPEEIGFYTMRNQRRLLHGYGINANPDESDLRAIDRGLLPEQLGTRGQQGFFVHGREEFHDLVRGRPIFHWFVLGAVGLLLAELLVQWLVKPRLVS